jgi:predicted HTH domain antitoxin
MPLIVSDELLGSLGISEEELRREVGVMLFQRERLTLAQASRLAGLSRVEFQKLLATRQIPIHFGVEEFREDLKNLEEAGLL